jgi:LacI family repressor for deo operon, udp, cdd, tsx, nupC, and nupG
VHIDDMQGAQTATQHLLDLGHTRIALIGGETDDPMRFTPPLFRRIGYLNALQAADVDVDPLLEVLGYFTVDGGEAAMNTLLDLPDRPTAVFAESDEMAYGAIRAIRRAGLRVPEDIAVIGFDDHDTAALMDLTTIRQPVVEQGMSAAQMVLAAVNNARVRPSVTILATQLIVRGSTDPQRTVYAVN